MMLIILKSEYNVIIILYIGSWNINLFWVIYLSLSQSIYLLMLNKITIYVYFLIHYIDFQ